VASRPDPPDLGQLRTQAKELKRAFLEGDQTAVDRILASHPKFAGRPAERLEGWHLTLRDAQVTIARELGFESWKALSAEVEGEWENRWRSSSSAGITTRASAEAFKLGHAFLQHRALLAGAARPAPPDSRFGGSRRVGAHL